MCLVVVSLEASERYSLIFCANRDERHARPSAAAGWWQDHPRVLGGRDLVAGGSWLALDRAGRLAAVTNFRTVDATAAPRSRGELVAGYVTGALSLDAYSAALHGRSAEYGPFSLLLLDGADLRYVSNRAPSARLGHGVHALSNAAYGVEWPKVRSARAGVEALLELRGAGRRAVRVARRARPRGVGRRAVSNGSLHRGCDLRHSIVDRRARRSRPRGHVRGAVVRCGWTHLGRGSRNVPA